MSSTIFGLQTSYKLGFYWLFTLFLRRLARCSSWAQGEQGSAPTYLTIIFQLPILKIIQLINIIIFFHFLHKSFFIDSFFIITLILRKWFDLGYDGKFPSIVVT